MFKKSRGEGHSDDSKTLEELQVIDENDCKASEMFSAAHVLREDIAVSLTLNIPDRFTQIGDMEFDELSEDELDKVLRSLPNKASTGTDMISNFLLKQSDSNLR